MIHEQTEKRINFDYENIKRIMENIRTLIHWLLIESFKYRISKNDIWKLKTHEKSATISKQNNIEEVHL